MASLILSRRLSSKSFKPSVVSSHLFLKDTEFRDSNSCFLANQTESQNPNVYYFSRFASTYPNPTSLFHCQALTQPKPTDSAHNFTKSQLFHAFVGSKVEKPFSFSQISSLKLKDTSSTQFLLKHQLPRKYSTFGTEKPQNPAENPDPEGTMVVGKDTASSSSSLALARSEQRKIMGAPFFIIYKKVFWHINEGIEEIMADYVHHEMTRYWILVYFRLFLLILMKDVFLSLVSLV